MNTVYNQIRYQMLTKAFDWTATDLQLIAWTGTPTFVETEQYVSQFKAHGGGVSERGSSQPITSKTVAPNGTAQTNQIVIPDVPVGPYVTHFTMVKKHPTTPDMSELILFVDDAFELPFVPNGLDLIVMPDWLENRGWWKP